MLRSATTPLKAATPQAVQSTTNPIYQPNDRCPGNQTGAVLLIVLMIMVLIVMSCGVLGLVVHHHNQVARQDNVAAMTALGFVATGESTAREIATRNGSQIVSVREWPATDTIAQQVTIATQSIDHEHLGVATARSVWLAHE